MDGVLIHSYTNVNTITAVLKIQSLALRIYIHIGTELRSSLNPTVQTGLIDSSTVTAQMDLGCFREARCVSYTNLQDQGVAFLHKTLQIQ